MFNLQRNDTLCELQSSLEIAVHVEYTALREIYMGDVFLRKRVSKRHFLLHLVFAILGDKIHILFMSHSTRRLRETDPLSMSDAFSQQNLAM